MFWIHASNTARFQQGYRIIASKAEIPRRDDPETNVLQLVYEWLCDERNGYWLMVLDNADDDDVFFSLDQNADAVWTGDALKMPLANFLPQTPNGSVLITSRNMVAAVNLVGTHDNVIPVEPLDEDDALILLKTRVPNCKSSEADERALVQALERIPLAITQAGAYILNRAPRITISTYLELFRQSNENQEHLLNNEDAKDLRRDYSIRHAVITTWQISFEQIRKTKPAATDLLALMSMFDRQGIPEYLLCKDINQLQFEDAVAPLVSFSLIRAEIGQQSFEMHHIVQLSIRKWLELNKQLERWRKESMGIIAKAFPDGQYETWATCQVLLPHSKEIMNYMLNDEEDVLNWAKIACNTGWYLYLRGEYKEAEAMHRRALDGSEKALGPEHPDTLTSVNNLGLVLDSQGKYGRR